MNIGIVNDCPLAVAALRRAVSLDPAHRVIWIARNGAEAVRCCANRPPHLVLMDLLMPEMDGVEATRRIMAGTPCPILIVTVSVGANSWRAFEAMGHGALDAVDTPSFAGDVRQGAAPLLSKIETLGTMLRGRHEVHGIAGHRRARSTLRNRDVLVAIGASAGGPAALAAMLRNLPQDFTAAVVVVQHVDAQFAAGMADWLDRQSVLPVRLAKAGDPPSAGTVLLAGTNEHLVLGDSGRFEYTPEPRQSCYCPSVDVFFQSASRSWRGGIVGVLLTGMGRDGALGLKALRNQGHLTIAQDQASSAVYGMPKAAAALNAAVDILPLDRIAARLTRVVAGTGMTTP